MTDFLAQVWIQRTAFAVGGLLLGFVVERVVVRRAHAIAERTKIKWDDLIVSSVRGLVTIWFASGGVYLAMSVGTVDPLIVAGVTSVLTVAVIGAVVVAAMRLAGGTVEIVSGSSDAIQSSTLMVSLARLTVGLLGIILILQNLGIAITPLITALGIGGLAVALALQDTLGNLFAGVQIILSGQVRQGDYVRIAPGEEGWVTDVKSRNTTIHTFPDGNLLAVPNSVLASSIVKNFSMPRKALWVSIDVGVSYDSDLEHVEQVTLAVAQEVTQEVDGGVDSEEPVIRYNAFADSSINFEVRILVREFRSQPLVTHEFIKRLHRRYNEEGIEIPFPIRTVYMKSEAED
jgi:small-conductance mechanosensitive channel